MIVTQPLHLLWAWLDARITIPSSSDFRAIGCVKNDCLCAVVGYTAWVGRTCVAHIAIDDPHGIDRTFVYQSLYYPFVECDRKVLLSMCYGSNERSEDQHRRLGFREYHRLPGCAPDGSDLIQFKLERDECRILNDGKRWKRPSST